MPYVTVGTDMEIYYEDHGGGQPAVLIHGYPFSPDRISKQAWDASFQVAVNSSPYATCACVDTWLTDFGDDLRLVSVDGGPHNICRTHSDEVNAALLDFLAR